MKDCLIPGSKIGIKPSKTIRNISMLWNNGVAPLMMRSKAISIIIETSAFFIENSPGIKNQIRKGMDVMHLLTLDFK